MRPDSSAPSDLSAIEIPWGRRARHAEREVLAFIDPEHIVAKTFSMNPNKKLPRHRNSPLLRSSLLLLLACSGCYAADAASKNAAPELPEQYREPFSRSFPIREEQQLQVKTYADKLLEEKAKEAMERVKPDFSNPKAYEASLAPYRAFLQAQFGTPPPGAKQGVVRRFEQVGEDRHCVVYRVWIEVVDGVDAYGIYMLPKKRLAKAPLLIAQHGGGGNPEAICDLDTRANYNHFGFEAVKRGYIVWAPALAMHCSYCGDPVIPGVAREELDRKLKLGGTSIVGLELYKIIESTRTLMRTRSEIDSNRVGMAGLSWGGFYTMYAAALNPFIKVAAPSGYLKDYAMTLKRSAAGTARAPERETVGGLGGFQAMALICPRPCMLQLGKADTIIDIKEAQPEVKRTRSFYERLGLADRFQFNVHDGGHVFEPNAILDFLDKHL